MWYIDRLWFNYQVFGLEFLKEKALLDSKCHTRWCWRLNTIKPKLGHNIKILLWNGIYFGNKNCTR